jgi:hypothetical protein
VALYFSYGDDSKDAKQDKIVVSAALFARKRTWKRFNTRWKQELRKHGLKYFKSSQCNSVRGEFMKLRRYPLPKAKGKAQKIRQKLETIIHKYRIYGVGVSVPVQVFKKVAAMPESHGYFNCDPYQRCLESIFLEVVRGTSKLPGKDNTVAFAHDDDSQFAKLRKYYRAFKKLNKNTAERMKGFVPLDDKLHPPLQAADLVANFSKGLTQDWPTLPISEPERFRKTIIKMGIWTEDYMLGVAKHNADLKAKGLRK